MDQNLGNEEVTAVLKSYMTLSRVNWQMITDVSENQSAFIFRVKHPKKTVDELFQPEHEDSPTPLKVGKRFLIDVTEGCTNRGCHVTVVTTFCTVAPNICVSSV